MGQHMLPGNPPVELTLRYSSRARRISLRVSGIDGRVTLTLPKGVSERAALEFAQEKASWLRAQLSKQPDGVDVGMGSWLPIEGTPCMLITGKGRRVILTNNTLLVPGPVESASRRVQAWLKTRARDRLAAASDHYAAQLGRSYAKLTLRDTRSRWGSCTSDGGLMYSWRLILAAPEILRYVAAHEVAHLAEMNHSPAFWAHVEKLYPDYNIPRRWLRQNGAELHRYRF